MTSSLRKAVDLAESAEKDLAALVRDHEDEISRSPYMKCQIIGLKVDLGRLYAEIDAQKR